MATRFSSVEKSKDPGTLTENGLVPYRDQTVFYGRITFSLSYGYLAPHLDDVFTSQAKFHGESTRTHRNFICDDSADHDLTFNVAINSDSGTEQTDSRAFPWIWIRRMNA